MVLPFMILSLQSVLENMDPSLEEAAGNLGPALHDLPTHDLPLALPG